MTRDEFIRNIDVKLKLIRYERDYTQDKMAEVLGISKKTLIQIEKGRASLGWMGAVALCTIFKDSEVLEMIFGGHPQDIITTLAFDKCEASYEKTMGGKIWWVDIELKNELKIQQNIISKHYRILDKENRRICSSFDYDYMRKRLDELTLDEK
ncbi:helix-turn-helix transcriptional regulator [Pseudobacteroides cellulosolvens]|uniref:Transcriptional regulator, XRE family n=1 Tax=Pseudobacteroides cellulosolvens ATCC 35603 = DSM 2933 TaxID=398512 RepID=A0A0L6JLA4_9FIRM|nr:helix-turn-helix domain-containing protein [Pseudobacteroides cellulosolvens]KNY26523.1 transcriptional regulator, XRE family [Pseudobacteroides cellulosolvens ATCC 35603 = DSM 2933]